MRPQHARIILCFKNARPGASYPATHQFVVLESSAVLGQKLLWCS